MLRFLNRQLCDGDQAVCWAALRITKRGKISFIEAVKRDAIVGIGSFGQWSRSRVPLVLGLVASTADAEKNLRCVSAAESTQAFADGSGWSGSAKGEGEVIFAFRNARREKGVEEQSSREQVPLWENGLIDRPRRHLWPGMENEDGGRERVRQEQTEIESVMITEDRWGENVENAAGRRSFF